MKNKISNKQKTRDRKKDKTYNFEKLENHVHLISWFHAITVAEKERKVERKKDWQFNKTEPKK